MRKAHPENDATAFDALAEEFAQKCRNGGCPSITQYAARYPELADEINQAFPAIVMMEQYSRQEESDRADTRRLLEISQRLLDRLGDYRIVREIGRGGMGVVYEAIQESLGRTVALKVLTANVIHAPQQLTRFQREAHAAAMLHHTNIVPIFGVGHDDGLHYYVMQYIDGIGMDELIQRQQPLPEDHSAPSSQLTDEPARGRQQAPDISAVTARRMTWPQLAECGIQIAQAVDYAHHQGVLHRDIKPANLLLDAHGTVWVTDFGLAKVFGDDALTQSGDVFGTLRYMAPEQFAGESTASSDIYSIGVTLYELATGQPAFGESDAKLLMRSITQHVVPRPRLTVRSMPRDLETIILKAAAHDPRHRYGTAGELAADLQRFCNGEPIAARRASPLRRLWRWGGRNPALAALSGVTVLLLLLVAIVASIGYFRVEEARQEALKLAGREREQAAQLRTANQTARDESDRARAESQRAEDNLQLAMRAFEDVISRISGRGLPESLELDLDADALDASSTLFTEGDAELLQSLLSFYEEFAVRNHSGTGIQRETAKAHHRIGDIRQSLGQFELASDAYREAIDVYQRIAGDATADTDILLAMVAAWNQRGATLGRSGRMREAVESHLAARDLLLSQPEPRRETSACRFALAETYNHLGALWYRADVVGPPDFPRGVAGRFAGGPVGSRLRGGTFPSMQENYHAALELLAGLIAEEPNNARYRLALARCHRNCLPLAWQGDSAEEAARCLAASVTILQQLVADFPDTPDYAFELSDVLSIDAVELRDTEFGQTSWQRLEQAEQIARRLNNTYPNQPKYKTLYANALHRLGMILERNGQHALAVRHLKESVKNYRELLDRFPSTPAYVASLGRAAMELGTLQREAGLLEESRQTLDEAVLRLMATYDPDGDMRAANRFVNLLQLNLNITQAELVNNRQ